MGFFKRNRNVKLKVESKKEIYRKGDKLKAKKTIGIYSIAKDVVYTVSEWYGFEVHFEEISSIIYGWYFERATKDDINRSVEIMRKFIEDKKIEKTVNPFVAYSKYLDEEEIKEHNISLHEGLEL
ncbi:hypothetical protein LCGC14_1118020 [marine sediment metagenome]|uniref:Uncharacterized protein n=1 Tax=marine sediment metagenome TaxID=412755 RepID=A0A0F9M4R4_9ZZZZ